MRIIYSPEQLAHAPLRENNRGEIGPAFEQPERARRVLDAIRRAGLGEVEPPEVFGDETILRVHDSGYVDFLRTAYDDWRAIGRRGDAIANVWPVRGLRSDRTPVSVDGRLALYSFDSMTPIGEGTWPAARAAANVALTAAASISQGSEHAAFALCRPPGHHAAADYCGGYCFLNNAAIAAQYLRDKGASRVAILDVDYHHGNGTQTIFYDRPDVLYVSIHADPSTDFPYFLGFADESGDADGRGYTKNLPLPQGSDAAAWFGAFAEAAAAISAYRPDALVVSLGVDTAAGDPLAHFSLDTADFRRLGQQLAAFGLPTAIVFEGGYRIDRLGGDVAAVLEGFDAR